MAHPTGRCRIDAWKNPFHKNVRSLDNELLIDAPARGADGEMGECELWKPCICLHFRASGVRAMLPRARRERLLVTAHFGSSYRTEGGARLGPFLRSRFGKCGVLLGKVGLYFFILVGGGGARGGSCCPLPRSFPLLLRQFVAGVDQG